MKPATHYFCSGLLSLLLSGPALASAEPGCATSIAELIAMNGDQAFALKWKETTMDDGRPLLVSILEKNGVLAFEFIKTGKGLWAETAGVVCRSGTDVEIRFTGEQIHFGPAAGPILRLLLGNGGQFTLTRLGPAQLRIATRGWQGDFVPDNDPHPAVHAQGLSADAPKACALAFGNAQTPPGTPARLEPSLYHGLPAQEQQHERLPPSRLGLFFTPGGSRKRARPTA